MAAGEILLARTDPFRLGDTEIRPSRREVAGADWTERLEPRVMQVLVALARADGDIVSRDDLVHSCWGGVIVGDNSVNRAVSQLRRVAAKAGASSFTVETINKVGYRLVRSKGARSDVAPPTSPQARRSPTRRQLLGGGVALALTGAGTAYWLGSGGAEPDLPSEAQAVLDRGITASRLGTAESTSEAVALLAEAVRIAPNSAQAWGALAIAHHAGQHFLNEERAQAARDQSKSAAERAVSLDPASSAGHAAIALAVPYYGQWLDAETALRRVLTLESLQFEARLALTRLLSNVGRTRAAVATLEPLVAQSPPHLVTSYFLGFLYWQVGRIAESDFILDQAILSWPRSYAVWFTRFWQRVHSGRARDALAMAADSSLRPIGIPDWNFQLIEISAQAVLSRDSAEARQALDANLQAARRGAGFAENAIELAATLGATDEAFAIADAYYFGRGFSVGPRRYSDQQGSFTVPARKETKLLFSPSTGQMRGDPRFRGLAQELGLVEYWRRSGQRADLV